MTNPHIQSYSENTIFFFGCFVGMFFGLLFPFIFKNDKNANVLRIKRLSEKATLPIRGSKDAVGYDLSSMENTIVPARNKALIRTGLSFEIPKGLYGRVAPRSGLACKKSIDVGAGVIDPDYRGEVGVLLFNHGDEDFPVKEGDRIAQLILEQVKILKVEQVSNQDHLSKTERGVSGYGSTGVSTTTN